MKNVSVELQWQTVEEGDQQQVKNAIGYSKLLVGQDSIGYKWAWN